MSVQVKGTDALLIDRTGVGDSLDSTYIAKCEGEVYTIKHNGQHWVAKDKSDTVVTKSRYRNDVFSYLAGKHKTYFKHINEE